MQYMVTFFDENGFPLQKATVGWLPISINPGIRYLSAGFWQYSSDVQTYKIHVRQLKPADMY